MAYGHVRADTTIAEDDIIAATCNNLEVEHAKGGLQYALDYSARIFQSGAVEYLHPYGGLSCSTFVLAAFASAGIVLIDDRDWPKRERDTQIQHLLVELLKSSSTASSEHIAAQEAQIGVAKRFRPTEVAAAAYLAATSPTSFTDLEALATCIQTEYEAAFG